MRRSREPKAVRSQNLRSLVRKRESSLLAAPYLASSDIQGPEAMEKKDSARGRQPPPKLPQGNEDIKGLLGPNGGFVISRNASWTKIR